MTEQLTAKHRVENTTPPLWRRALATLAVFLAAFVGLSAWSLSTAVGGVADDDFHLSSMWCTSFAGVDCEVDPEGNGVMIPPPLLVSSYCLYHNPAQSAGCQPFMDGTDPREDFAFGHNNPMRNLNPDGFYQVGNLFKSQNIESTVMTVRLFNSGLFLGVTLALWLLLPVRLKSALSWMWPIGLMPLGMFFLPSTNPSSWAIIAVGSGWLAMLGYLETRGWRSYALAAIYLFSLLLAASSRIDAILYLGLVSLLAVWQSQISVREIFKKTWIVALAGLFVAFRLITNPGNLQRLIGGINTGGDRAQANPWIRSTESSAATGIDWGLMWNNVWSVPGLWTGVFGNPPLGSLGWLDTALPHIVFFGVGGTVLGLVFLTLQNPGSKKTIALVAILIALWSIPVYLLQISGAITGTEFQPRYLLPLMIVAVGTIVLTDSGTPLLTNRPRLIAIFVALTTANSIALHTNIRRYVTGVRVEGFDLDSQREWWWGFLPDLITPNVVWAVGTLAFAVVAWVVFVKLPRQGLLPEKTKNKNATTTRQESILSE
jgi:hypothetical protein